MFADETENSYWTDTSEKIEIAFLLLKSASLKTNTVTIPHILEFQDHHKFILKPNGL